MLMLSLGYRMRIAGTIVYSLCYKSDECSYFFPKIKKNTKYNSKNSNTYKSICKFISGYMILNF